MRLLPLLLLAVLLAAAAPSAAQRLPSTVQPEPYAITFTLDFGNDTFAGDETVHLHQARSPSVVGCGFPS